MALELGNSKISEDSSIIEKTEISKKELGYLPRNEATQKTYTDLGFMCGLEIHQQLLTKQKLFCRCPAGIFQQADDYDAEVIRHMRPTLSELGEYDGTALMEFKTKKNITYRLKNKTACTYEIDDTPPFLMDREALEKALVIAFLLKTKIVGELHIARKQYLDGSIPTGFQRTGILGIDGEIPLKNKKVGIIQISIEEDSCREVSDIGHNRTYMTDRLGMPLIEMVTYPHMLNPDEAVEAGQYLSYLARSSGKVRTGIGAARQDVNVSITGGTRVEIKGVAHISWIAELTHIEAFRQKALLNIKELLNQKISDPDQWKISSEQINPEIYPELKIKTPDNDKVYVVKMPGFSETLSYFTQPGQIFADEISQRLKVIACIEKPNMTISNISSTLRDLVQASDDDGVLIIWGPEKDIPMALETIEERGRLAFDGVPNETRKSFPDGTTIFERVLPGADRMYPDTDTAPMKLDNELVARCSADLPAEVSTRMTLLDEWKIPIDTHRYILRRNLVPIIEKIVNDLKWDPKFVGCLFGHNLKNIEGTLRVFNTKDYGYLYKLAEFIENKKLDKDIFLILLPIVHEYPDEDFEKALIECGYKKLTEKEIIKKIPELIKLFRKNRRKYNTSQTACARWVTGQLCSTAIGNIAIGKLYDAIVKEVSCG